MSAEKLLSFVEDFNSSEITSQNLSECYDLIDSVLSILDIESKLKYPNDYCNQYIYKYMRLEYLLKDFAVGMLLKKSNANNTNQFICKLLNKE